jgi:hypothetical protein
MEFFRNNQNVKSLEIELVVPQLWTSKASEVFQIYQKNEKNRTELIQMFEKWKFHGTTTNSPADRAEIPTLRFSPNE